MFYAELFSAREIGQLIIDTVYEHDCDRCPAKIRDRCRFTHNCAKALCAVLSDTVENDELDKALNNALEIGEMPDLMSKWTDIKKMALANSQAQTLFEDAVADTKLKNIKASDLAYMVYSSLLAEENDNE